MRGVIELGGRGSSPYGKDMGMIALLIAVGLVLLFLETLLPGLIAGALGMLSLAAAVGYAYMEFDVRTGNMTLAIVLLLLGVGTVLWVKFFPQSAIARMFVLNRQIGNVDVEKPELLGHTGTALTSLRPAGTAVFNGKRVDVVADGTFVEKGRNVKVVAVEGMRVVVRGIE
jgi:membrane-bound serine protease (ClpP class)